MTPSEVLSLLQQCYIAARGTSHLQQPQFTRSQMYWKGRADAAADVRKIVKEFEKCDQNK